MEKTVASGLEDLELKQSEVFKSWKELSSQASNVLSFTLQWDDLQNHFDSTRRTLQAGLESLSEREKAVASREEAVEARESRFEAEFSSKKNHLEGVEKLIEEQSNVIACRGLHLQSLESAIQERREELDVGERQLASIQSSIEERKKEAELREAQWEKDIKLKEETPHAIAGAIARCWNELELKEESFLSLKNSADHRSNEFDTRERRIEALLHMLQAKETIIYVQYHLRSQLQKLDSVCNEVYGILRASSNPAKFILDAIDGFYPSNAKEFDVTIVRRSCILLLKKLAEVAPRINSQVKGQALKLANDWISRSKRTDMDYLEASGIVLLINSYGLASEVDSNDLCRLLYVVGQHRL